MRMKETGKISSLEDEAFRDFLKEAIQYMADFGLAWMDTIQTEDQVVAASLNFVSGQSIYYYMGGFDDQLRAVGPGNALFARAMQRGIDNHFRYYDFLRGDEPYKYRWGATDKVDTSLSIYSRGYISSGREFLTDAAKAVGSRIYRKIRSLRMH
jgi:CelD/BcsL family acetyltransferase involved in cellulose biosynthesis